MSSSDSSQEEENPVEEAEEEDNFRGRVVGSIQGLLRSTLTSPSSPWSVIMTAGMGEVKESKLVLQVSSNGGEVLISLLLASTEEQVLNSCTVFVTLLVLQMSFSPDATDDEVVGAVETTGGLVSNGGLSFLGQEGFLPLS